MPDFHVDVRDKDRLGQVVNDWKPEVIFHMAAQALVRRSYRNPVETWSTNVMGTVNLLDVCRTAQHVKAVVVVTTDKCYENREWAWGYRETDVLGGSDPYSASKAAAEIVSASYRAAFFGDSTPPLVATARAGNVIGGGDWAEDRLIPDLVRARAEGRSLQIRSPNATRPWQHVLESLSGYLLLGQHLLEGDAQSADAWNFGPEPSENRTVASVLDLLATHWPEISWDISGDSHPKESHLLYLDSSKVKAKLGWTTTWSLEETLSATAAWYREFYAKGAIVSISQLADYISKACGTGAVWTQ
jgi:CDP-glucose 4,6-dehydratase